MLLLFAAVGSFVDNFLVVFELLMFPFVAVAETGNRIVGKISSAFDSEETEWFFRRK